jgi:hypothetical protein
MGHGRKAAPTWSIRERVHNIAGVRRNRPARSTQTQRGAHALASADISRTLRRLWTLNETELRRLEEPLHQNGRPCAPGLAPDWKDS